MNPQLAALRDVVAFLDVDYWLFGGWREDFRAGRIQREHSDVDLAISERDKEHVAELLAAHGWTHAADPDEHGGTGYERDGVRLELTYYEVFSFPESRLGDDVLELEGVRARILGD